MNNPLLVVLVVLVGMITANACAEAVQLQLTATGSSLGPMPITTGIPLPQGAVADPNVLRLTDAGQSLPIQVKPLSLWPDGTLRWVQLHVSLTDATPSQEKKLLLTDSAEVPVAKPTQTVEVTETEHLVSVDTGPLQFSVSRLRLNGIENVWVDGRQAVPAGHASGLSLALQGFNLESGTLSPAEVVVEEAGPLRVIIRANARVVTSGGPAFNISFRIYAFAGARFVRIDQTFTNVSAAVVRLQELSLHIPFSFRAKNGRVGLEGSADYSSPVSGGTLRLAQSLKHLLGMPFTHRFNVTFQDETVASGRKASGWIKATGEYIQATLGVQDFWQLYPKGLFVSADQIGVELWPKGSQIMPVGQMDVNAGAAFTHQLVLGFSTDGSIAGPDLASYLASPPLALPSPQWFSATGATIAHGLSPAVVEGETLHADWDALVEWMVRDRLLVQREVKDEYGLMHYGDYLLGGQVWNNLQYDLPHCLMQQFFRTGDRQYLDMAWAMVRHQQNVDILWQSDVSSGARTHRGYGGEWRGGAPHGRVNPTEANLFINGMIDIYTVTGEARTFEAIKWVADGLANYSPNSVHIFRPHGLGWRTAGYPMSVLAQAYQLTLDERYRTAAIRILKEAVLPKAHTPDNGYAEQVADGVWWETEVQGWENQAWMIDQMGAGLLDVYQVMPPGPLKEKTADTIIDLADWARDKAWDAESKGWVVRFKKSESGTYSPIGVYSGFMAALGLTTVTAAFELTGDNKYLDFGRTLLDTVLHSNRDNIGSGKQVAQTMQYTPYFLAVWDSYIGAWPSNGD